MLDHFPLLLLVWMYVGYEIPLLFKFLVHYKSENVYSSTDLPHEFQPIELEILTKNSSRTQAIRNSPPPTYPSHVSSKNRSDQRETKNSPEISTQKSKNSNICGTCSHKIIIFFKKSQNFKYRAKVYLILILVIYLSNIQYGMELGRLYDYSYPSFNGFYFIYWPLIFGILGSLFYLFEGHLGRLLE